MKGNIFTALINKAKLLLGEKLRVWSLIVVEQMYYNGTRSFEYLGQKHLLSENKNRRRF
jgi:hypothetical protein